MESGAMKPFVVAQLTTWPVKPMMMTESTAWTIRNTSKGLNCMSIETGIVAVLLAGSSREEQVVQSGKEV